MYQIFIKKYRDLKHLDLILNANATNSATVVPNLRTTNGWKLKTTKTQ
jgi:hypothetical protein